MISRELNEQLTGIERGQPAGEVLRRYWQPAALTEELDTARPVVPVTLFGERLVLFRDGGGTLGLLDRACPHRGVDLCYARLEAEGYAVHFMVGSSLPMGSVWNSRVSRKGRSTTNGSAPGRIPWWRRTASCSPTWDLVNHRRFQTSIVSRAPSSHVFAFKVCGSATGYKRWRSGLTPRTLRSYIVTLEDEDPNQGYGQQFRDSVSNSELTRTQVMREYARPEITVEDMPYGLKLTALRHMENGKTYARISNAIFPAAISIAMSRK